MRWLGRHLGRLVLLLLLLLLKGDLRTAGLNILLDDSCEDVGVNEIHEDEGLEDSVSKLRGFFHEAFGCLWVAHGEGLHL